MTHETVELYILSQLQELNVNLALYWDDGLAVCNKTPLQTEKIKKQVCKTLSRENSLEHTVEANVKTTSAPDITMNLKTGWYSPYMKPNNIPLHTHKDSNHSPNTIRNA